MMPSVVPVAPTAPFAVKMNTAYNCGLAHAFILHGNGTVDYADNENSTIPGVLNQLWRNHAIVAHYSMAAGISFPEVEAQDAAGKVTVLSPSRDRFLREIGVAQTTGADDALAVFKDVNKAIPFFDQMLRKKGEMVDVMLNGKATKVKKALLALVIDMAEFIIPDGDLGARPQPERKLVAVMERWGRDPEIMLSGNVVVLTTRSLQDIHVRLRMAGSKYEAVEMPIPTYEDRLAFVAFARSRSSSAFTYEAGMDDAAMARLTAGLSRVGIEDIIYQVVQPNPLTRKMVTVRKDEIIRTEYADVIEMLDPTYGFDSVGGYTPVKQMFAKRIVARVKDGLPSDWPGVLLVGPPGTGKTTLATALAYECGIPALRLNIGALKNKFVGETEKNLRRALSLIREMAPVLVFIDEVDTALPNRQDENQDSGVSKGILEAFMPFLSDPDIRKKVQFVGASNRSDGIDAALKRVGRFDKIIPMLMPVFAERVEIIKALWPIEDAVKGLALPSDETIHFIAGKTKYESPTPLVMAGADFDIGWSGSELRGLIRAAGEEVKDGVPGDALRNALQYVIANTADVWRLTVLALRDCNDLRLLPEGYRKGYDRAKWAQEAASFIATAAVAGTVERTRRTN